MGPSDERRASPPGAAPPVPVLPDDDRPDPAGRAEALAEALDHALAVDGAARDAYLATLPAATRGALEVLLREALADDPLLDHPAAALATLAGDDEPPAGAVEEGAHIGPYRLEALVGEGGMGRVFRARRADGAFDQTVALKVVRLALALAGTDVSARLRRERAVLAGLDHPGIARLLDGGETPDGVPYLVTEYVDGAPITAWADARGLDVGARVRLMIRVARAVEHAHRRFVVHRDLKPSNVLVTERDGAARPVVLDFGIAKLLDAAEEGDAVSALTRTGVRLLTPAYAAPELYGGAAVTAAADVYGLGALLYELLTGRRPHDDAPATGLPPTREPARPSRALATGTLREAPAPDAARRVRALRGDLDTIVLKALHPDPTRRYATAAALADDLQRHLDGRPVEARPDSLPYVVGRLVRRNRVAAAAAALALVALVGGLTVSLVLLSREREARAEAETAGRRAEGAARFLTDVFNGAIPELTDGRAVTAREALDSALVRVDAVEPATLRGHLLTILGQTYAGAGEQVLADSLLVRAVRILAAARAPAALQAEALYELGRLRGFEGDHAAALRCLERARSLVGRETPSDLRFDLTRDLAWLYRMDGQYGRSLTYAREAVRLARERAPSNPAALPAALWERASTDAELRRFGEATATMREVVRLYEKTYGPHHARTAMARYQLGWIHAEAGDLEQAEQLGAHALRDIVRAYGTDHFRTLEVLPALGELSLRRGRLREGEARLDSSYAIARRIFPPGDRRIAPIALALADARNRRGAHASAEALARETLARGALDGRGGREAPLAEARAHLELGLALAGRGRHGEARRHLRLALRAPEAGGAEPTASRALAALTALGDPDGEDD